MKTDWRHTIDWYKALSDKARYQRSSKIYGLDTVYSISAIVACYRDNLAIPIMYERLKSTLTKLNIDFEIIFVNDCSPDDTEEVIRAISAERPPRDRDQSLPEFRLSVGLQERYGDCLEERLRVARRRFPDPPELIEQFVAHWRRGHDVVFGRRVEREAPFMMQLAYKGFYRAFDAFSYIKIPHDAGDFSLMDKRVVQAILSFPERDLFLRDVRAFAGFRQTGVDYVRPERMFGRSTNNLFKNIGWAKKGILSFSNVPLNMISFAGVSLLGLSLVLGLIQIGGKLLFPDSVAPGITTTLLLVLFFGSLNFFGISLLGEYLAKIFRRGERAASLHSPECDQGRRNPDGGRPFAHV